MITSNIATQLKRMASESALDDVNQAESKAAEFALSYVRAFEKTCLLQINWGYGSPCLPEEVDTF